MSTGKPTPRRLTRRREEARALFRNAILEAAEQVFAEVGFHTARIQDIAKRARIAVGTVYNHFEQKEDLLSALLEERTEELLAELHPRSSDPVAFPARLERRIQRLLAYVERHRSFFMIVMNYGIVGTQDGSKELVGLGRKRLTRLRGAFRALVEEGIAQGALEPLDTAYLAAFLGGTLRALTFSALLDEDTSLTDRAPWIVRLFLHGAARRAGS